MADEGAAVVLDDGGEVGLGESTAGDPGWELAVPDTVVSTEELTVLLREVGDDITAAEGEGPARGLGRVL